MKRELNKIFDVKSRKARRDILDKFELSADDKNKVLNKIGSGEGDNNIKNQLIFLFYQYSSMTGLEYNYCVSVDLLAEKIIYSKYKDSDETATIIDEDEYINTITSLTNINNNSIYPLYVKNIDFNKKQILIKAHKINGINNPWNGSSGNIGFLAYDDITIKNFVENPSNTPQDKKYTFNPSLNDLILPLGTNPRSGIKLQTVRYLDDITNTSIYPNNFATYPITFVNNDGNKILELIGDVSITYGYWT